MLQIELLFLAQISTKLFGGWGFAPDPTGGSLVFTELPRPPSCI